MEYTRGDLKPAKRAQRTANIALTQVRGMAGEGGEGCRGRPMRRKGQRAADEPCMHACVHTLVACVTGAAVEWMPTATLNLMDCLMADSPASCDAFDAGDL